MGVPRCLPRRARRFGPSVSNCMELALKFLIGAAISGALQLHGFVNGRPAAGTVPREKTAPAAPRRVEETVSGVARRRRPCVAFWCATGRDRARTRLPAGAPPTRSGPNPKCPHVYPAPSVCAGVRGETGDASATAYCKTMLAAEPRAEKYSPGASLDPRGAVCADSSPPPRVVLCFYHIVYTPTQHPC